MKLWKGFNGQGLYAERADKDKSGNVIDLTYLSKEGDGSNVLATFTKDANDGSDMASGGKLSSIFTAISNFFGRWRKTVYGSNLVLAEDGSKLLDENGTPIYAEDSTLLYDAFDGVPFGAERSLADRNGSIIDTTYVNGADEITNAEIDSLFDGNVAVIAGRLYPIVTIGSQTWMAENLDFLPEGIELHDTFDLTPEQSDFHMPVAWYYNNDEATAKARKYGLLYNTEAVDYMESNKASLFPGWHVPTKEEIDTLINTVGYAYPGRDTVRMAVSWAGGDWHNEYCTNTTGFSAIPSGDVERQSKSTYPRFYREGVGMSFWSTTSLSDNIRQYYGTLNGYSYFRTTDAYKVGSAHSIRLIKDT